MKHWLSHNRRRAIAGGALLLTGVLCWLSAQERQPVYGGKRILEYFPGWFFQKAVPGGPGGTVLKPVPGGFRGTVPGFMPAMPPFLNSRDNIAPGAGPEAIPWLLRVIRREDSIMKRFYTKHRNRLPAWMQRALPIAVPADINRNNACAVLIGAIHHDRKASLPLLLAALKQGSRHERIAVANLLRDFLWAAAPAQQALAGNLFYNDREVQNSAFEALLRLSEVVRQNDFDESIVVAMTGFWKIRGDVPLSDLGPAVRFSELMSRHGPRARAALPALTLLRTNGNPLVRVEATHAIWRIDPSLGNCGQDLLQEFSRIKGDASHRAGEYLAWNAAAMNLRAAETVAVAIEALRNKGDAALRRSAALILTSLKAEALPALPELKVALRDANHSLRSAAVKAIESIGPEASDAIPVLVEALADPAAQEVAVRVLGAFGPAAAPAAAKLVELLMDSSRFLSMSKLRRDVAVALGRIGDIDGSVMTSLRKAAEDSDPDIREAAKMALQQIASGGRERVRDPAPAP